MRKIIQYIALIAFATLALLVHYKIIEIAHSICPYSVVCYGTTAFTTSDLGFLFLISTITGAVIALSTIFIGRIFCGWVCPLGTLQDIIFKLNPKNKKLKAKGNFIPLALHKILLKLKYLVLIFTVVASGLWLHYLYERACPVYSLVHVKQITIYGIISLLVLFVPSFFINRFWCRYVCPYAALMNSLQYLGKFLRIKKIKIFRNIETCCECNICNNICSMKLDVMNNEITDDVNCIKCCDCIKKCPRKGTLENKF